MKKTLALAGFALLSLSTLSFAQTTNIVAWNFSAATPSSGLFTGLATPTVVSGNNKETTTMLTTTSPSSGYTTAAGFTASTAGNAGAAAFKPSLNLATSTYF